MQVTVNIPDELAEQARRKDLDVGAYVEELLARYAREQVKTSDHESVSKALDRIAALPKGNRLRGNKIKDLIR